MPRLPRFAPAFLAVAACLASATPARAQRGGAASIGLDTNNWQTRGGGRAFRSPGVHSLRLNFEADFRARPRGFFAVVPHWFLGFTVPFDGDVEQEGGPGTLVGKKWFQFPGVGVGVRAVAGPAYVSVGLGAFGSFPGSVTSPSTANQATIGGRFLVGGVAPGGWYLEAGVSVPDLDRRRFTPGLTVQFGIRN